MLYSSGCPQDKRAVNVQNKLCWTENTSLTANLAWCYISQHRQQERVEISSHSSVGRWVGALGPCEHIPLMLSQLDAVIWHQMSLCILTLVTSFFKYPKARIWSVTKANQLGGHYAAHGDLVSQGSRRHRLRAGPGQTRFCACPPTATLLQCKLHTYSSASDCAVPYPVLWTPTGSNTFSVTLEELWWLSFSGNYQLTVVTLISIFMCIVSAWTCYG